MNNDLVLVPKEPTAEIIAAAAAAAWPVASKEDIALATQAAMILLRTSMAATPGASLQDIAAAIATMASAYRAMINAAPKSDLDAMIRDAARWRYAVANSSWIRDEECTYMAILVGHGADISSKGMREDAIDAAMAAGRGEVG
ncbi:MAG TPA: hypothetical protein VIM62_05800 [Acidobacteriaceae bacterium]